MTCWLRRVALVGLVWAGLLPATAQTDKPPGTTLRVGVLAYTGKAEAQQQWGPTMQLLQDRLPGYALQLVPLDYDEVGIAVQRKALEFVLTNPVHFVALRGSHDLQALATLTAR
jgi:ABC-type phosphate/phosphonate transport system substrate-binding protein